MKGLLLSAALLCFGVAQANAATHYVMTYRDIIRPHGHLRSDAAYNANLGACYRATGESRMAVKDTAAFKSCMSRYGWRFVSQKLVHDPETRLAAPARTPSWPQVTVSTGGTYSEEELDQQEEENDQFTADRASQMQDLQNSIDTAAQASAAAMANQ